MAFLEKWRPSKELVRFRGEVEDLLERFGFDRDWLGRFPMDRDFFGERAPAPLRPAIESRVQEGRFIVRTDLPGIDQKDIDITVVGEVLTIKGSREEKHESKRADFFKSEIRYGYFERSISLPEGIKADDLKATYHDGVLELSAPIPKESAPKEVKIQVAGSKGNGEKKFDAA